MFFLIFFFKGIKIYKLSQTVCPLMMQHQLEYAALRERLDEFERREAARERAWCGMDPAEIRLMLRHERAYFEACPEACVLRRAELLHGREAMERTVAHYEERLRTMAERPSEPAVDEARYEKQLVAMRGAMMALEEELHRLRAEREILGVDFCQTQTLLMETQDALARERARADQFVMELAALRASSAETEVRVECARREEALVMAHRAEVERLEASKNWQIRVLKEKHYKCAMRLRELLASGGVPKKVVCFIFVRPYIRAIGEGDGQMFQWNRVLILHTATVLASVCCFALAWTALWLWLIPCAFSVWWRTFLWCAATTWLVLDNLSLAFDLRMCFLSLTEMAQDHELQPADDLPALLTALRTRCSILQQRSAALSRASVAAAHWSVIAERARAMAYVAQVREVMEDVSRDRYAGRRKSLMGGSMRVRRSLSSMSGYGDCVDCFQ